MNNRYSPGMPAFPSPQEAAAIVHAIDRCAREVPAAALKVSRRGTVRVVNRRVLLAEVLEVVEAFLQHRVRAYEQQLADSIQRKEADAREEGQMRVLTSLADLLDMVEALCAGLADPLAGKALTKRIERLFGTFGFERITTVGAPFDPHLHEAVDSEVAPGRSRGEITREVTAGFRRGDFVLREARVVVAE